jgi:hypothetical protein
MGAPEGPAMPPSKLSAGGVTSSAAAAARRGGGGSGNGLRAQRGWGGEGARAGMVERGLSRNASGLSSMLGLMGDDGSGGGGGLDSIARASAQPNAPAPAGDGAPAAAKLATSQAMAAALQYRTRSATTLAAAAAQQQLHQQQHAPPPPAPASPAHAAHRARTAETGAAAADVDVTSLISGEGLPSDVSLIAALPSVILSFHGRGPPAAAGTFVPLAGTPGGACMRGVKACATGSRGDPHTGSEAHGSLRCARVPGP